MTDYFALLSQPRRPWLEPEQVTQVFVSAAAAVHPDRLHSAPPDTRQEAHQRYVALNEAHLCLKDTRSRLRHLLELERGGKVPDLQEMPDDLMALFGSLTQQFKITDTFLKERAAATSPLLRVSLFERGEAHRTALLETQALLQKRISDLENSLRALDQHWVGPDAQDPQEQAHLRTALERLYRLISFHDRWLQQVRTRLGQLME